MSLTLSDSLLPGHGDPEPFLGINEVVMIILAKIELHPVDLAREPAVARSVVGGDRGTGLVADVGGLVGGEDHRLRGSDPAGTDLDAVVVQSDVAALGQPTTVVGEFCAYLVGAGRNGYVGLSGELLDTEHVV